jgi:hypothetical protein
LNAHRPFALSDIDEEVAVWGECGLLRPCNPVLALGKRLIPDV